MATQPDILFVPSSFGGGWLQPLTARGRGRCLEHYCEPPFNVCALGDQPGYLLEPWQVRDDVVALREAGATVELFQ